MNRKTIKNMHPFGAAILASLCGLASLTFSTVMAPEYIQLFTLISGGGNLSDYDLISGIMLALYSFPVFIFMIGSMVFTKRVVDYVYEN